MVLPVGTLGVPRIGPRRELKAALEAFWAKRSGADALLVWSAAPKDRSNYTVELTRRLPFHVGLTEADARELLREAGFTDVTAWQRLFRAPPYPDGVPAFVLSAITM